MFNRIVTQLISGKFICKVSFHDGHNYLSDPVKFKAVDDYLRQIDLRVGTTESGMAFYPAHADVDDQGKKAAKAIFADMKNNIRPLVSFLDMVMRTTRDDNAISPGEKLELNKMMNIIAQNPSLTEALRTVANQTKSIPIDGSDRKRLELILKKFKNDGYLEEVNKEEEIYRFTGKVDYAKEVNNFLMEHDQISEEDEAFEARRIPV